MKLDLEDIGMCLNKSLDNNIHMVEKTTQTECFPVSSSLEINRTPNGTTPCNHPSMSCQVSYSIRSNSALCPILTLIMRASSIVIK